MGKGRFAGWLMLALFGFAGALAALSGPSLGLLSVRLQQSSSQEDCPCLYCPPEDPIGKAGGQDEAAGAGGGDPCCGGEGDHNPGGGGGASGGHNMPLPKDGQIIHSSTDIASGGFGGWGHTRVITYPCKFQSDPFGFYKENSWKVQEMSRLAFEPQKVTPVNGALWQGKFGSQPGGSYLAELFYQNELTYDPVAHEFTLFDTTGGKTIYDDEGLFKRFIDPAGNVRIAVWGTIGSGPVPKKRLFGLTIAGTDNGQTVSEIWEYFYFNSGMLEGRLAFVTLRRSLNGGAYELLRRADYTYLTAFGPNGTPGDLEFATITDGLGQTVEQKYYRYHSTGRIWMALGGRPTARLMHLKGGSMEGVRGATHGEVEALANLSVYFENFGFQRVIQRTNRQEGGRKATSTFEYEKNQVLAGLIEDDEYDQSALDKFNTWETSVTETLPDGNKLKTYMSMQCMPMLKIFVEGDRKWRWWYRYDGAGRLAITGEPSAVLDHDENLFDLVGLQPNGDFIHIKDNDGLLHTYTYYSGSGGGGAPGYKATESIKRGDQGVAVLLNRTTYVTHQIGNLKIFPVASFTTYKNEDGSGGLTTSYAYTFHSGSFAMESRTTTPPLVGIDQNGSGLAQPRQEFMDLYQRVTWIRDEDGFIQKRSYDLASGAILESIRDVNTAEIGGGPGGWTTPAGGGLHLKITSEVDPFGRTLKITDPKGNVTYRTHNDVQHERRSYPGWNPSTNRPTGPTHIHREDWALSYDENIRISAQPDLSSGRPTGLEAITSLEGLTRKMLDNEFRVSAFRSYHTFAGMSYTPLQADLGSFGTNYDESNYSFDPRWRVVHRLMPTYSTEQYDYDGLSRVLRRWKGVPDATLYKVEENEYDFGLDGADSNLTKSTSFGNDTQTYVTEHRYDWRNRRSQSRGPDRIGVKTVYDNIDRVTLAETYADTNEDFGFDPAELRRRNESHHDDRSRTFRTVYHEVSSSGVVGNRLESNTWYNGRGQLIKTRDATGSFSKCRYDGAGRKTRQFTCFDALETTYEDAFTVAGDTVIEQSSIYYDSAGNPAASALLKANDNNPNGQGELTTLNSFAKVGVNWYDRANRITHAADFGRDNGALRYVFDAGGNLIDGDFDGIPNEAENLPREPIGSTDYLVAKTDYDDSGYVLRITDNLSRKMVRTYDRLGRVLRTINNYVDGVAGPGETDTDQTIDKVYGSGGKIQSIIAHNPKAGSVETQETRYFYGSPFDAGYVTEVIYPDSSATGPDDGGNMEKTTYDRLGRRLTFRDQRGAKHVYRYDSAGRMSSDTLSVIPAEVDGAVQRIRNTYDDLGRRRKVTSFSDADGTLPVNEVRFSYDGWDHVTKIEQNHAGEVGAGTPFVRYDYEDGATDGVARYRRLVNVHYPTSRNVHLIYPAEGTVGHSLNRLDSFATSADGATKWAQYTYYGSGDILRIQKRNGVALDYGSGGSYSGLDRFRRVLDQKWVDGAVVRDHTAHTYDGLGLRRSRSVLTPGAPAGLSEAYEYDGLNRLAKFNRGTPVGGAIADAAATYNQAWTLDALGNWSQMRLDLDGGANSFAVQNRAHNKGNEIDVDDNHNNNPGNSLSGDLNWIDPKHDAAGNMISGPQPGAENVRQHFVYDGWGRIVEVKADAAGVPGATIARYRYDGINWRIQKIIPGVETLSYFYGNDWQVLEIRRTPEGGTEYRQEQYLWDTRYQDSPIVRWRNADGSADGSVEETLYYCEDANYNVTALTSTSGAVVERYAYDAYGAVTVFDPTWGTRASSAYANDILFAGMRRDSETGLYQVRHRYYHVTLGRFLSKDPILENRSLEHYAYCAGQPLMFTDPLGLMGGGWSNTPGGQLMTRGYTRPQEPFKPPTAKQVGETALDMTTNYSLYKDSMDLWNAGGPWYNKAAAGVGIVAGALDDISNLIPGLGWLKRGASKLAVKAGKAVFIKEVVPEGVQFVAKHMAEPATQAIKKVDALPPLGESVASVHDTATAAAKQNARGGAAMVEKGQEGVEQSRAMAKDRGDTVIGDEITFELPGGKRTRADLVTRKQDGSYEIVESKKGEFADLTPNQKKLVEGLDESGHITLTPRGKKAAEAGLTPGVPVTVTHRIDRHK